MRQVYNPQTMEDEILMVSGMPLRIGKTNSIISSYLIDIIV